MTSVTSNWDFWRTVVQAVGYAVTWIIVIYGWRVNNAQNRERDQRKDLREQIDLIGKMIRRTEAEVVDLLSEKPSGSRTTYWTVYFGVQRISASVCRIEVMKEKSVVDQLIAYRVAVTDKALPGPASALALHEAPALLKEVSTRGNNLIKALEARYSQLYP